MNSIQEKMVKFYANDDRNITINACPGHFATSQSHINYYIDVTRIKMRVREAEDAAKSLYSRLLHRVETVDTIVCLDGTEVLGGFLARELEKGDFHITNRHETMYVVTPEENSIHQFMFRENNRMAIEGKSVLILTDTTTTGTTINRISECISYYGGTAVGVASIFSIIEKAGDLNVYSIFQDDDIEGYKSYEPANCPFCQKKIPLDAIVNGYGYAKL